MSASPILRLSVRSRRRVIPDATTASRPLEVGWVQFRRITGIR